jgi:hypothetical protein
MYNAGNRNIDLGSIHKIHSAELQVMKFSVFATSHIEHDHHIEPICRSVNIQVGLDYELIQF